MARMITVFRGLLSPRAASSDDKKVEVLCRASTVSRTPNGGTSNILKCVSRLACKMCGDCSAGYSMRIMTIMGCRMRVMTAVWAMRCAL
jgi:hypothetical protein